MKKLSFNENWSYRHQGEEDLKSVTLPHDAMIHEKRVFSSYGHHNAFFEGKDYVYEKSFSGEGLEDRAVFLEFEGVYQEAEVYLNGKKIGENVYGYRGFYIDLSGRLQKTNTLTVVVKNSAQPNSRWYTGGGIYRPVTMLVADKETYIPPDSIRITTLSYDPAKVESTVRLAGNGEVTLRIYDGEALILTQHTESVDGTASFVTAIENAKLWSVEQPHLYRFVFSAGTDQEEVLYGIRHLECTPAHGLQINGTRVILKGACIHHDNGLLGAEEYDCAAERKVRLLKSAGYNCIRSAHNPCSKALLAACDRLGMLMVDEYTDMWYIHKNKYDYAGKVQSSYREDIEAMVAKDYNHPCVIMYSSGNEVAETSQKKGIEFTKDLTDWFHHCDATRPVTCGINIFFNFLATLGIGMASDKEKDEATEQAAKKASAQKPTSKRKRKVGSEFFNELSGFIGSDTMKIFAMLPPCDWATREAFANMDVAGYNYAITRYRKDLKKYPQRLILGSETFIADTKKFMDLAKENERILGDFAWTGFDYIGEVGLGSLDYDDYAEEFEKNENWLTAGCGVFDITGGAQGQTAFVRVVYGMEDLAIAVRPADRSGDEHVTSAWRKIHAFESWSWNGCDGHEVLVEVYSWAEKVALFINGEKIGEARTGKTARAKFKTVYRGGEVSAIAYDTAGNVVAEKTLTTAAETTRLTMVPEKERLGAGELAFVQLSYTDEYGTLKPLARGEITVEVEGGELAGLGSACPYNERGYKTNSTDTYYGKALAIIKPYSETVTIRATSKFGTASATVVVKRQEG